MASASDVLHLEERLDSKETNTAETSHRVVAPAMTASASNVLHLEEQLDSKETDAAEIGGGAADSATMASASSVLHIEKQLDREETGAAETDSSSVKHGVSSPDKDGLTASTVNRILGQGDASEVKVPPSEEDEDVDPQVLISRLEELNLQQKQEDVLKDVFDTMSKYDTDNASQENDVSCDFTPIPFDIWVVPDNSLTSGSGKWSGGKARSPIKLFSSMIPTTQLSGGRFAPSTQLGGGCNGTKSVDPSSSSATLSQVGRACSGTESVGPLSSCAASTQVGAECNGSKSVDAFRSSASSIKLSEGCSGAKQVDLLSSSATTTQLGLGCSETKSVDHHRPDKTSTQPGGAYSTAKQDDPLGSSAASTQMDGGNSRAKRVDPFSTSTRPTQAREGGSVDLSLPTTPRSGGCSASSTPCSGGQGTIVWVKVDGLEPEDPLQDGNPEKEAFARSAPGSGITLDCGWTYLDFGDSWLRVGSGSVIGTGRPLGRGHEHKGSLSQVQGRGYGNRDDGNPSQGHGKMDKSNSSQGQRSHYNYKGKSNVSHGQGHMDEGEGNGPFLEDDGRLSEKSGGRPGDKRSAHDNSLSKENSSIGKTELNTEQRSEGKSKGDGARLSSTPTKCYKMTETVFMKSPFTFRYDEATGGLSPSKYGQTTDTELIRSPFRDCDSTTSSPLSKTAFSAGSPSSKTAFQAVFDGGKPAGGDPVSPAKSVSYLDSLRRLSGETTGDECKQGDGHLCSPAKSISSLNSLKLGETAKGECRHTDRNSLSPAKSTSIWESLKPGETTQEGQRSRRRRKENEKSPISPVSEDDQKINQVFIPGTVLTAELLRKWTEANLRCRAPNVPFSTLSTGELSAQDKNIDIRSTSSRFLRHSSTSSFSSVRASSEIFDPLEDNDDDAVSTVSGESDLIATSLQEAVTRIRRDSALSGNSDSGLAMSDMKVLFGEDSSEDEFCMDLESTCMDLENTSIDLESACPDLESTPTDLESIRVESESPTSSSFIDISDETDVTVIERSCDVNPNQLSSAKSIS